MFGRFAILAWRSKPMIADFNPAERNNRHLGRLLNCISHCAMLALIGGCASSGPVQIPSGDWTGCGTFVYESWAPDDKSASLHKDYPTKLHIHRSEFNGRPAVEMEIVSRHGGLPGIPDDKTHLRMMLVEEKRPSDSIALFRVAGMEPDSDQPPEFDANGPPVGASCFRTREAIVLHVVYDQGFADTFRFRGRGLTKSGSMTTKDEIIHWAETLYQVPPVDMMSSHTPFR